MQTPPNTIDIKAATANPTKFFKAPPEVLAHPGLSRAAKIDILHQWEIDARQLSVAEEENLTGGEPSQLGAVVNALISLGDEDKKPGAPHPSSPAKAGA